MRAHKVVHCLGHCVRIQRSGKGGHRTGVGAMGVARLSLSEDSSDVILLQKRWWRGIRRCVRGGLSHLIGRFPYRQRTVDNPLATFDCFHTLSALLWVYIYPNCSIFRDRALRGCAGSGHSRWLQAGIHNFARVVNLVNLTRVTVPGIPQTVVPDEDCSNNARNH